jgi:hypothetical protein
MSEIIYAPKGKKIHIIKSIDRGFYVSFCGQYVNYNEIRKQIHPEEDLCLTCKKANDRKSN